MYLYIISWILNLIWIALVVGIFDELLKTKIEENQGLAALLIFVLPTLMELFSYTYFARPFMFGAP